MKRGQFLKNAGIVMAAAPLLSFMPSVLKTDRKKKLYFGLDGNLTIPDDQYLYTQGYTKGERFDGVLTLVTVTTVPILIPLEGERELHQCFLGTSRIKTMFLSPESNYNDPKVKEKAYKELVKESKKFIQGKLNQTIEKGDFTIGVDTKVFNLDGNRLDEIRINSHTKMGFDMQKKSFLSKYSLLP